MITQGAIALGALALASGCTVYTSCPDGQRLSSGQCVSGGTSSPSGGGGNVPDPTFTGPVPTGLWSMATGNLSGMSAGYGNVCNVSSKPNEDLLIAGISAVGLWASRDGGDSWQALGTGPSSVPVPNRANMITYDPDHSDVFWEAGPYGEGVFQTKDDGTSFTRVGEIENTDGIGIDFTDPDRKTLLASVHEHGRTLYRTADGGTTWTDISDALPADTSACNYPIVIDSQTYLFTCSQYNTTIGGVYRSTDAGQNWDRVSPLSAWAPPLLASDGSIYWSMEADGGLLRSTDQGLTWKQLISGTLTVQPIELPDGRIATVTKQYVVVSSDHGASWHLASSMLPVLPAGLAYSAGQKAFAVWYLSPEPALPADSIMRYAFDYRSE